MTLKIKGQGCQMSDIIEEIGIPYIQKKGKQLFPTIRMFGWFWMHCSSYYH